MKIEDQINNIIKKELSETDKSPFSPSGFDIYLQNITSYMIELFRSADYFAKKQGKRSITGTIVNQATEKIYRSFNDKILNFILAIAGLSWGAGISHIVTLTIENSQVTNNSIIFIAISMLSGAFMFGYYLFR